MRRYPRLTAHVIAESLGYATPSSAARILKDAREARKNYCEWIYSCYDGDPLPAVKNAIRNRHTHRGLAGFDEEGQAHFRRHRASGTGLARIRCHGKRARLLQERGLGLEDGFLCPGGSEGAKGRERFQELRWDGD